MKKLLIFLLILTILPAALISCGEEDPTPTPYKILFTVDGKVIHSVSTMGDSTVELPEEPTKSGYTFDGWYWDLDTFKRPFTKDSLKNNPYTSNVDVNVYAKFVKDTGDNSSSGDDGDEDNEFYDPNGWHDLNKK